MEFQVGDLVRPAGAPARSQRWELALIVGIAREIPIGPWPPDRKRLIAQVLGGELRGRRIHRWASYLEKVEK